MIYVCSASRVLESLVSTPDDPRFQDIFHRVLIDGNWPGAQQAAAFNADKIGASIYIFLAHKHSLVNVFVPIYLLLYVCII